MDRLRRPLNFDVSTCRNFMLKLPLAHVLPAQSAIFFAVVVVLSGVFCLVRALARFGLQRFARRAFTLVRLTWHCSGSATPPTEFRR